MIRRPRASEPDRFSITIASILEPLQVWLWGTGAMGYLGVPMVLGSTMIVLEDEDLERGCRKLKDAGFTQTVPNRTPRPEVMARHPDPQQMLDQINSGFRRMDQFCRVFDWPAHHPHSKSRTQILLFPNSFAHLAPLGSALSSSTIRNPQSAKQCESYRNLYCPLEPVLVESVVKAAIDEENEVGFSSWGTELGAWISYMTSYLEVNNDILDNCEDRKAVEWYSTKFGRIREAKNGPIDYRVSKRLGSGKEMPVDMRGNPISSHP